VQLAGERARRHCLASSRRADEKELSSGVKTVLSELRLASVLTEHACEGLSHSSCQDHVSQLEVWVGRRDKLAEIASWLSERDGPRRRDRCAAGLHGIDRISKLLRQFPVSLPSFARRELQRSAIEARLVARREALD